MMEQETRTSEISVQKVRVGSYPSVAISSKDTLLLAV